MSPFDPFPTLETPRLRLRALVPEDAEDMFRVRSDPRVARYTGKPTPTTLEMMREKIDSILQLLRAGEAINWALTDLAGSPRLGGAALFRWDKPHFRAELGYELDPACWGRGLVPEALAPVLRFGFEQMALHSVEARIHPDNHASIRVVEKLGFRKEGHFRENYCNEGVFEDTAVYSLLRP